MASSNTEDHSTGGPSSYQQDRVDYSRLLNVLKDARQVIEDALSATNDNNQHEEKKCFRNSVQKFSGYVANAIAIADAIVVVTPAPALVSGILKAAQTVLGLVAGEQGNRDEDYSDVRVTLLRAIDYALDALQLHLQSPAKSGSANATFKFVTDVEHAFRKFSEGVSLDKLSFALTNARDEFNERMDLACKAGELAANERSKWKHNIEVWKEAKLKNKRRLVRLNLLPVPNLAKDVIHRLDDVERPEGLLLKKISNALNENEAATSKSSPLTVVGVYGPSGAGKSQACIAVANEMKILLKKAPPRKTESSFFELILWLQLKQDIEKREIAHLMEVAVEKLTDPHLDFDREKANQVQTTEVARADLTAALAGKRVLIVLDDVWRAEEAMPILDAMRGGAPGSGVGTGSVALVSTQSKHIMKDLECTDVVEVTELTWEDARNLLRKKILPVSWDEKLANKALEKVGQIALGVAAIGGAIRIRGWQRVISALERCLLGHFDNEHLTHDKIGVIKALQVSVDALESPQKERYLDLAVMEAKATVAVETMSFIWKCDELEAQDTIDILVDRSLLQVVRESSLLQAYWDSFGSNHRSGEFRLHDLQRMYIVCRETSSLPSKHVHLLKRYVEHMEESAKNPESKIEKYIQGAFNWHVYEALSALEKDAEFAKVLFSRNSSSDFVHYRAWRSVSCVESLFKVAKNALDGKKFVEWMLALDSSSEHSTALHHSSCLPDTNVIEILMQELCKVPHEATSESALKTFLFSKNDEDPELIFSKLPWLTSALIFDPFSDAYLPQFLEAVVGKGRGRTALHLASRQTFDHIAALLRGVRTLANKKRVAATTEIDLVLERDTLGRTVLHHCVEYGSVECLKELLCYTEKLRTSESKSVLKELLLDELCSDGTVLHSAARRGDMGMLKLLVETARKLLQERGEESEFEKWVNLKTLFSNLIDPFILEINMNQFNDGARPQLTAAQIARALNFNDGAEYLDMING